MSGLQQRARVHADWAQSTEDENKRLRFLLKRAVMLLGVSEKEAVKFVRSGRNLYVKHEEPS